MNRQPVFYVSAVLLSIIGAPAAPAHAAPPDGVQCQAGYTGKANGNTFTCSKGFGVDTELVCPSTIFTTYVTRAGGPAPKGDFDLCERSGVVITSNSDLHGLKESTNGTNGDYVFANIDKDKIDKKVQDAVDAEAKALGISSKDISVIAAGASSTGTNDGVGGKDRVHTPRSFFTYPLQR